MNFKNILVFLYLISCSLLNANTQIYYGKIDFHYPITMKLTFNDDHSINGHYFYNKWKKKIELIGTYEQNNFSMKAGSETFTGVFSDKKISGNWKNSSSSMGFYGYSEKSINPFEDNKLTCEEMKMYPEQIFNYQHGIDLGSGYGSPISVDYGCEGSLETFEFTKKLYSIAENIRSERSNRCSGSIIYAHWRYYHFDLLKAGLIPELYTKHSIQDEKDSYNVYRMYKNQKNYFAVWGHSSLYNYELYKNFWNEYDKTYPLLVKHYEKSFSVTEKQAEQYAKYSLREFVLNAAGSFQYDYQGGQPDLTLIEKMMINPKTTLETLHNELQQQVSKEEMNQGLKVAILYDRDLSIIEYLLKNGANINSGDESALFFALKNKKLFTFLLENGADVNYRNSFGKTVLYYAIELGDIDIVKILIENGANLNNTYIDAETRDDWNRDIPFYQSLCSLEHTKRTPLMHAAQHSDVEMLKYLILKGANKEAIDEIDYNVLDYAHMEKKEKNIAYLESIGLTTKRTYW